MRKETGFTLIELLLVLAIIGIISAIAVPALMGQRESARNRATQSNASNVAATLQQAIGIVEDEAMGSRSALDLDPCASQVSAVLVIVGARPEFNVARNHNPFNTALPTFTFGGGPAAVAGEVNSTADIVNGSNGVSITYVTSVQGAPQPPTKLSKRPESSMAL